MGRGKMDEAAAARIRKARGDKVRVPKEGKKDDGLIGEEY